MTNIIFEPYLSCICLVSNLFFRPVDHQENRKLASKLPKWTADLSSRIVYQFKTERGSLTPFSEFVKFLSREADIACDPVLSSQSI